MKAPLRDTTPGPGSELCGEVMPSEYAGDRGTYSCLLEPSHKSQHRTEEASGHGHRWGEVTRPPTTPGQSAYETYAAYMKALGETMDAWTDLPEFTREGWEKG